MDGSDWTAIISKLQSCQPRRADHLDRGRCAERHVDQAAARRRHQDPVRQSRASTRARQRAWGRMRRASSSPAPTSPTSTAPKNKEFLAAMQKKFGAELKTPNDLSVPQYEGVYAYKRRWRRRARPTPDKVIAALAEVSFDGPRGKIQMNKQRHAPLTMYLGQVQKDGSVKMLETFPNVDPGRAVPEAEVKRVRRMCQRVRTEPVSRCLAPAFRPLVARNRMARFSTSSPPPRSCTPSRPGCSSSSA